MKTQFRKSSKVCEAKPVYEIQAKLEKIKPKSRNASQVIRNQASIEKRTNV